MLVGSHGVVVVAVVEMGFDRTPTAFVVSVDGDFGGFVAVLRVGFLGVPLFALVVVLCAFEPVVALCIGRFGRKAHPLLLFVVPLVHPLAVMCLVSLLCLFAL